MSGLCAQYGLSVLPGLRAGLGPPEENYGRGTALRCPPTTRKGDVMPHSRLHPLPRFTRFPLTVLLCGLLWYDLGHLSLAANLTASSTSPRIFFDDTNTVTNPDWLIFADQFIFEVFDNVNGTFPFTISPGAPDSSLAVRETGNVGLGTFFPQGNLHIFGAANQDLFSGMGPDLTNGPAFNFGYSGNSFGPGTGFFNVRGANSGVNPSLRFATANVQRLIITNAGRVGIGTLAPTQPLDVNGNIRANGSFISGATTLNVPDYVFEPNYQLMPLTELGSYVAREKHLPDVPSAQEIKEQGVNVSELQMQLLKKVEELTLYAVEQERINHQQTQTISAQGKLLQQLTARLAVLERTRQSW